MAFVGGRLTRWRKAQGLSQQELARKIGISQAFVSSLELGRKQPSLQVLEELSRAMNVPIEVLLSNPPPPPETAPGERRKLRPVKRDRRRL